MNKLFIKSILVCTLLTGCKKMVDVGTGTNQLTIDKVFADSTSAYAATANIYALFEKTVDPNFSKYISLYTDELNYTGTSTFDAEYLKSVITPGNSYNLNIWKNLYFVVYQCNDLLEQLPLSKGLSVYTRKRLEGEAKFLRAFSYMHLIGVYSKIPLILSTNANINRIATQQGETAVFAQMVLDLTDAKNLLLTFYEAETKVRATKWAAAALLARIYLYQENWKDAEKEATAVIASGMFTPLENVNLVFKANSRESILQFWTQTGFITSTTSIVPIDNTTLPAYPLSQSLYDAFDDTDLRKSSWIGSSIYTVNNSSTVYHYVAKYKNRKAGSTDAEYLTALRVAEQYLIRAEARANLGLITGNGSAADDLNIVRNRAGIGGTSATTLSNMLTAIENERRRELFTEWGDRFYYLKYRGKLNSVLENYKSGWISTAASLPIPQYELTYGPALEQNQGYH
jgi:hypothetical protein